MKKFQWIFYVCGWCLLLGGCVNDLSDDTSGSEAGKMKLVYSVPGMADARSLSAQTRADAPAAIDKILLLFFDATSDHSGAFIGSMETTVQNKLPNGVELLRPTGKVDEPAILESKSYHVWAIANYVENGLTKKDILTKANTATEHKLKSELIVSNSNKLASPLLMSGSSLMSGKDKIITVALQRNVARIEVINEIKESDFKLTSLRLIGMRQSSFVMDMKGGFPLPFLISSGAISETLDGKSLVAYAFESYAEEAPNKELYAIVGGTVQDVTRFYRLSINRLETEKDSKKYTQKIDRNTSYTLQLKNILGIGAATWEEAASGAIDLITVAESDFWEEQFDGIYTYAADGIGFAPSKGAYEMELLTLQGAPDEKKKLDIKLYWSNKGVPLLQAPTEKGFKVEMSNTLVVKITSDESRGNIACSFVGFGKVNITVTYNGVSRIIPVELKAPNMSPVMVENTLVAAYNAGTDAGNPYGKLYSSSESVTACPPGWRLPTVPELGVAVERSALFITENGFLLTDSTNITIFPFGGYQEDQGITGLGTVGRYWTTSFNSFTEGLSGRQVVTGEKEEDAVIGYKTVSLPSTARYSVRCVATVDNPNQIRILNGTEEFVVQAYRTLSYSLLRGKCTGLTPSQAWRLSNKEELEIILNEGRSEGISTRPGTNYVWEQTLISGSGKSHFMDAAGNYSHTVDANSTLMNSGTLTGFCVRKFTAPAK